MRCKRRLTIYFPATANENEIALLKLELAQYFGFSCIKEKVWKKKKYAIYVNKSLVAVASSVRGVRARFWGAWRRAKKMGVRF